MRGFFLPKYTNGPHFMSCQLSKSPARLPVGVDTGYRKTLDALLTQYLTLRQTIPRDDVTSYERSPSIEESIRRAAQGKRDDDLRHSHQKRLTQWALNAAETRLLERLADIRQATDFDALLKLVHAITKGIPGLGDLYKYDTALRIGRSLKALPKVVYLHRGARVGARALGLEHKKEFLTATNLPEALRHTPPDAIEDFLCVYKDRFNKGTADLIVESNKEFITPPADRIILICINRSIHERPIYDAVRYAWRVNPERAKSCDYIIAHAHGIVKGVFKPDTWLPATHDNFKSLPKDMPGRFGFTGKEASSEIKAQYIGKSVPAIYRKRGAISPVRYSY